MTFSNRLLTLIGDGTVSDFARRVGLGESLIRKYLKGSEPTLSRARQIAEATHCSLEWLATGEGHPYHETNVVNMAALQTALQIIADEPGMEDWVIPEESTLIRMIAVYQYLLTTKLRDGEFDEPLARSFARFLKSGQNLESFKAERIR